MPKSFKRFDVHLVTLDPTVGHEIQKTRPCVIISPNVINEALHTIIVAPMTSQSFAYPFRISTMFQRKKGMIVLDQMRSVDKQRLVKRLGKLNESSQQELTETLIEMFE